MYRGVTVHQGVIEHCTCSVAGRLAAGLRLRIDYRVNALSLAY
jgi:hypothetical protein